MEYLQRKDSLFEYDPVQQTVKLLDRGVEASAAFMKVNTLLRKAFPKRNVVSGSFCGTWQLPFCLDLRLRLQLVRWMRVSFSAQNFCGFACEVLK